MREREQVEGQVMSGEMIGKSMSSPPERSGAQDIVVKSQHLDT